jgi:hypothetical protein
VGLAVKHRQLARQVGKLTDDHQKNPMASFNFEPAVLVGSCGFNSHLTNLMNSESFSPASPSESGEVLLPELADEIERLSVFRRDIKSVSYGTSRTRSNLLRSAT